MNQKLMFLSAFARQERPVIELCRDYEISRKTAYKWLKRFIEYGPQGLEERSRARNSQALATSNKMVEEIIALRKERPSWGAKKLLAVLKKRHPKWKLPARTTVCDILKREGLTKKRRRRPKLHHPGKPTTLIKAPNDLWTIDFKGEFKTRDGKYCYPLTVADAFSRHVFGMQAFLSPNLHNTKEVLKRLFREYGLPRRIRSDNGPPFASTALCRLSRLSVWLIRLGIEVELIEPGKPQQNGRHERMHKTMKSETRIMKTLKAQQRFFNWYRQDFNQNRPHEALGMRTPSEVHRKSDRKYPEKLDAQSYPGHYEIRIVSGNGAFRWKSKSVLASSTLRGQYLGLEAVGPEVWKVYFCRKLLGFYYEGADRIEDINPLRPRNRKPKV